MPRLRARAPTEGSILPRLLPHFRSTKITVLAVGGALCVATAASAVAATWPSVSGAPSPAAVQQAAAGLAAAPSLANAGSAAAVSASQAAASAAAVQQAAQRKAAAAAATREHAAHVAHEAHVTAVTLAARAAQQAAAQRAAQQKAAQQATQQATPQPTQQSAPVATAQASVPSGSAQQIAQGMLASFGWSSSQFSCLQPLWEAESGWSVSAQNPSSGAYGIPQALPGSKMASAGSDWATNPATQIKWGLEYIQSTYGSPCAAWSHEESDGWY